MMKNSNAKPLAILYEEGKGVIQVAGELQISKNT